MVTFRDVTVSNNFQSLVLCFYIQGYVCFKALVKVIPYVLTLTDFKLVITEVNHSDVVRSL